MFRVENIDKNAGACHYHDMKEAVQMLDVWKNGSKMNTTKGRAASFLEICSALAESAGISDLSHGGLDCLFNNEPAQKAFIRLCKHNGLEGDNNSILSVTGPEAVPTDCIISAESTIFWRKQLYRCRNCPVQEECRSKFGSVRKWKRRINPSKKRYSFRRGTSLCRGQHSALLSEKAKNLHQR